MKNNQTRLNPALVIKTVLTNLGIISTLAIPAISIAATTKPILLAEEAQQVQFAPEAGVFTSQPVQPQTQTPASTQAQGSQASGQGQGQTLPAPMQAQSPTQAPAQPSTAVQNQPAAQAQEESDASSDTATIKQNTPVQPVANAAPAEVLSASDAPIYSEIVQRLQLKFPGPLILKITNGNVTIAGMAKDNPDATRIIANIIATAGVKNFNFSALTLANGYAPSRIAIAIGFTQGRMIRTKLFGANVTLIDDIPVKVTANNNIIYLDGGLYTLYTKTQSIIIAQRAALQYSPQTRVISRLYLIPRPAAT